MSLGDYFLAKVYKFTRNGFETILAILANLYVPDVDS